MTGVYRRLLLLAAPALCALGALLEASAPVALGAALALVLLEARAAAGSSAAALRVARRLEPTAFEDDPVTVELALENHGRRRALLVELGDSFEPGIADRQAMLEPGPLGPARRRRLRYRTFCSRRWGEYRVGPLTLTAADPLGLFPRQRVFAQVDRFAVLPRVLPVPGIERLGARPSLRLQQVTAPRPGESLAFLGVRDYRPGDERRRIHWPATARRGEPVVRELEVDRVPYFTLLVDLERAHRAGTGRKSTLDYVVRTAASIVWSAARHGHLVQLLGEDATPLRLPPGSGSVHLTRCLLELVRLRQLGTVPILDLLEASAPLLPPGSTAALLTGSSRLDESRLAAALGALERRGVRPLVFLVHDASFTAIDRRARSRADADAHCERLAGLLRGRGIPGAVLSADRDLAAALEHPEWMAGP